MSLVPDYDDSLASSESDEDDAPQDIDSQPEKMTPKLPKPDFFGNSASDPDKLKTSVFKNPFTEAESAKEAILQKHVKMVDAQDNVIVINGKKICWNYRKGRCRFGHNCKYAHDSDIQKTKDQIESEKQTYQRVACQSQHLPQVKNTRQEARVQNSLKRKKRPGLTQGLVPGKKVMKNYVSQKK